MSRHLHHLPIPQQDLDLRNKARLGAAALLLVFMSALVVIAPDAGNPFIDGSHHASAAGDANAAAAE
jgi:hypothetical protein